ncbi:MAG: SCO family protein [Verrucomicrobiota bacterium]
MEEDPKEKTRRRGDGETRRESGARFGWVWGVLVAMAAIVPALVWGPLLRQGPSFYGQHLSPGKAAYDFELTDHNGNPLRLSQLRGKLVLLSFGFTHCPNICPTTLTSLNRAWQLLPPEDRARVQVVFISIDPKRDTPEQLKKYVPFFNPTFLGATSSEAELKKIAREYGAFFEYVPDAASSATTAYSVTHSAYVYLIDPEGKLAVLYRFEQLADASKMAGDMEEILKSKPERASAVHLVHLVHLVMGLQWTRWT